ncbi:MAG: DUF2339 domain-containing protein [Phycisphaerales bacterium]|nr:DUF2339 domain-containing protein [Phycisphaerales bacterium]
MTDEQDNLRLGDLLRRIESIEKRLDALSPPVEDTPQPPPIVPPTIAPQPAEESEVSRPDPIPAETPATKPEAPKSPGIDKEQLQRLEPQLPVAPGTVGRLQGALSNLTIENLVGGRLYAILGALLVIIATGILLKLAWDAEIFNLLPDQLKCVLAAAFGAVLLTGGEFARRRISAWASIGLTTAGLGVLYATSYAAWGVFSVVPAGVGFGFLIATTALGIVIGARGGLASVAAFSLVGGYLSPLMFVDVEASAFTLPVYLFALLCVGMILCARYGGTYALLRSISWWGTIGFGTGWLLTNDLASPAGHMMFIGCVWSVIQLELVYSATRGGLVPTSSESEPTILESWWKIRPLASSITTTAWAIAIALVIFNEKDIETGLWLIPICLATVLIGLSAFNVGLRPILCTRPVTDLHRLATVFVTQAGALVLVAVAIAFEDWTAVIAWTVLGVGAVLAGEVIRSRALVVYGIITQAVGGTNLMLLKWWMIKVVDSDAMAGFVITRGTILMAVAALGWLITGMLIRRSSSHASAWRKAAHVLMGLGITMSLLGFLNSESTMFQSTWVFIVMIALIMTVGTYLGSRGLQAYGVLLTAWTFLLVIAGQWWWAPVDLQFVKVSLTAWWWPMLSLSGVAFGSAWTLSRIDRAPWRGTAVGLAAFSVALLFASFTHEDSAATSIIVIWLVLAGIVMAVHPLLPRLALSRTALIGTLATIIPWALSVADGPWNEQPSVVLFTHGLWWSLLVVAAIGSAAYVERRLNADDARSRELCAVAMTIGTFLVFVASSFEVAKLSGDIFTAQSAIRSAVSIWWGLFAIGLLVLGFVRDINLLRYGGLSLLALAAGKAVLYDLASVSAAWRAMSFLVLGLLMLGVGVGYARAMSARKEPGDATPDSPLETPED